MKRSMIFLHIVLMACFTTVFGQMQLSYLYSRAVKDGASLQTSVDSLTVDMKVNAGLAVSRYTLVITPGTYTYSTSTTAEKSVTFDSIEITASFQLPSDFVADSMWLWINGEPVPAAIQDRALASAQYQQIVGVRKDPAILETWGRGSYNLRIFPASSFKSRKITIEFHHTFNDDSLSGSTPLITACIPLAYDSAYIYNSRATTSFEKGIGVVVANFSADDQGTYGVDLPGIGSGSFSASDALTLSARRVFRLLPGTITSADPSAAAGKFNWIGLDPKDGGLTAGIAAELSDATMQFEAEPDVRIIAIDMRNAVWNWNDYYTARQKSYNSTSVVTYTGYQKYNVWERAQKYAVLALRQYLKEGQKFNVLIGGKTVQSVFDAPVAVTAENLIHAVNAIVAAAASPDASTEEILKAAIDQAPGGIVVLISDLIQPPDYTAYVNSKYVTTKTGAAYDTAMNHVRQIVRTSSTTLFTIDDNYQLLQLALETGGFRLSGILNQYNIAYHYEVIQGKRITVPELPDLFGSANYSGIRNVSVTSDALTDITYTLDGYYGSYYYTTRSNVMIESAVDDAVMAKMALPSAYNPAAALIRVAGKLPTDNSGKPFTITVRGKTGGLWFTSALNAWGSFSGRDRLLADPQWAFRKSEQLGYADYLLNAAAIKTIGKEYHIVTRQTSLLALEPGMELWEDTAWQQSANSAEKTGDEAVGGVAATTADASYRATNTEGGAPTSAVGSGVSFDGISLADIIARKDIAAVIGKQSGQRSFSVTPAGAAIRIAFTGASWSSAVSLRLFDLKGRLVAQRSLTPEGLGGSTVVWNLAGSSTKLTAGMYTVRISTGGITKNFRITLLGN